MQVSRFHVNDASPAPRLQKVSAHSMSSKQTQAFIFFKDQNENY